MSTIQGMDALQANLLDLEQTVGRAVKSAYIAGGKLVEGDAKSSIQTTSPGEKVTRSRNGGGTYEHIASPDGGAPNTDTGSLVRSINTEVMQDGVFVGTSIEYGVYLEFGTSDMEERPWLIPALDGRKDDIMKLHADALNSSIRKAAKIV